MPASAAIFLGFGDPKTGRERQASRVFNETVAYLAGLQAKGEIESFEPCLLTPHGGDLGGFLLIRGERGSLDRIRASREFGLMVNRAAAAVANVGVVDGTIGEALQQLMGSWLDGIADLI